MSVGLGRGVGVNLTSSDGSHTINGGVFGHTGREAVRRAGKTATLVGSLERPLVMVRGGNLPEGANHTFTLGSGGQVSSMEHVSVIPAPGVYNAAFNQMPGGAIGRRDNVDVVTDPEKIASAMGIDPPAIEVFKGWLTPEKAWLEAQNQKKEMLLFFYSPDVQHAESINKLLESDSAALSFLGKKCPARVNIKDQEGQTLARNYDIYKVPTLLIISPDAKVYKKITPDAVSRWRDIEPQLKLN